MNAATAFCGAPSMHEFYIGWWLCLCGALAAWVVGGSGVPLYNIWCFSYARSLLDYSIESMSVATSPLSSHAWSRQMRIQSNSCIALQASLQDVPVTRQDSARYALYSTEFAGSGRVKKEAGTEINDALLVLGVGVWVLRGSLHAHRMMAEYVFTASLITGMSALRECPIHHHVRWPCFSN